MNEANWLQIYLVFFGGGTMLSILVFFIRKIRKSGVDETISSMQKNEVKRIKEIQVEHARALKELEKHVTEIDRNIAVRLAAIETDISYIREMQRAHNDNLNTISDGIQALLNNK